jgi:uncharacterized small protein (DUF1192 family)
MSDIEHDLFQAARDAKSTAHRDLLERALAIVRVAETRRKQVNALYEEVQRLKQELGKHV